MRSAMPTPTGTPGTPRILSLSPPTHPKDIQAELSSNKETPATPTVLLPHPWDQQWSICLPTRTAAAPLLIHSWDQWWWRSCLPTRKTPAVPGVHPHPFPNPILRSPMIELPSNKNPSSTLSPSAPSPPHSGDQWWCTSCLATKTTAAPRCLLPPRPPKQHPNFPPPCPLTHEIDDDGVA